MFRSIALALLANVLLAQPAFRDGTYYSKLFRETRHYRLFLPRDYDTSSKRYPVIYYFHGHSDRYTLEKYDNGLDAVPKIASFVKNYDVIVVAMDGYVARDYTGFYGGAPYDVERKGGEYDFGEYFLEFTRHIDSTYRTLTTRRFRATSGLSMGGFLSLYLSARYPDVIGSASAFNPGPEFFVGEKLRRTLWRPKDHVLNHEHTKIRLIRASGDYISQYHEETRLAYASTPTVDFEFRQDEYHRHWATSIRETFDFHMRAFDDASLDRVPEQWNYTTAFQHAKVRNYDLVTDSPHASLTYFEHVSRGGMRIRTRQWAPDGPVPSSCSTVQVTTAPVYRAGASYRVTDYDLSTAKSASNDAVADSTGRLRLDVDCKGHELGISGPGIEPQAPILLPLTTKDVLRVLPGKELSVPVRIFNAREVPLENVRVELSSDYPTVEVLRGTAELKRVAGGESADLSSVFRVRFTAGDGDFARTRLRVKISYDGNRKVEHDFDVMVVPDHLSAPADVAILDGRTHTFPVFHQKGNQGGGQSIERSVSEGKGNGDGRLNPGEQATVWVKLPQGLDPFDKHNWCRTKIYADSPLLSEIGDIQEEKQREWTGAQNRTSLIELSPNAPDGTEIPAVLDCEAWSFHYTPDVRYGKEPLYQAFQLHKHYLFAWTFKVLHQ
jgi:pimeloyl-ACP methyl ester carboxylesterase